MALKSTVFKVSLSISDITRGYYEDHALTIARHPSETDVRMLVRIIAFALNAHEHLQFTKGLSSVDEPDLWQIDLTGEIQHWIDLGQPVEKRIRQSCSKANRVTIYTYQKSAAHHWWKSVRDTLERFEHLSVMHLAIVDESVIERLVDRTMTLSCVIEDGLVMLTDGVSSLSVEVEKLQG
jgi:uncharacterized protein YaeQ